MVRDPPYSLDPLSLRHIGHRPALICFVGGGVGFPPSRSPQPGSGPGTSRIPWFIAAGPVSKSGTGLHAVGDALLERAPGSPGADARRSANGRQPGSPRAQSRAIVVRLVLVALEWRGRLVPRRLVVGGELAVFRGRPDAAGDVAPVRAGVAGLRGRARGLCRDHRFRGGPRMGRLASVT